MPLEVGFTLLCCLFGFSKQSSSLVEYTPSINQIPDYKLCSLVKDKAAQSVTFRHAYKTVYCPILTVYRVGGPSVKYEGQAMPN